MECHVTVFLHLGDRLMPKSFPAAPLVGETIFVGGYGRLTVTRIEYDDEGDTHVYLAPAMEK